jgi:hypothetical protein
MKITTLLAYWTDQKNQADKELSDARADLTKSQTELAVQRANLTKANQELAALLTQSKKIHADLSEAVTSADAHAIESNLAKNISDTRTKQAEIIGIEAAIDTAQTTLNLANARVNAATTRISEVNASLKTTSQPDKVRVRIGEQQAGRVSNLVTISGLIDHPFKANDIIAVIGVEDTSFNNTFTISSVTNSSITYSQPQVNVEIGKAVRNNNFVTISGLIGHPFRKDQQISVKEMDEKSFDGSFTISSVTDDTITYPQALGNATSGGGKIQAADSTSGRGVVFGPPLSTLVTDATATLKAKLWTDAKVRIEADFPQELRDYANKRAKVELADLDNDQQKADEINNLLGAVIDKIDNLREVFINADADFRDYVVNAKRRFDQALSILTRVADTKQNPLTIAERLSIHSKKSDGSTDTALKKKRNDAAAARKKLATAQIDVDAKQTDFDISILNAKAKDKDPDTDQAVKTAKDALTTAQTELAKDKTDFTSEMQSVLTEWEAAVPDTTWRYLADFEDAKRLLTNLQKDPDQLVKSMDEAEADLVALLQEADKNRKKLELLKNEAEKAATKLSFDTGILPRRLLAALRGDS